MHLCLCDRIEGSSTMALNQELLDSLKKKLLFLGGNSFKEEFGRKSFCILFHDFRIDPSISVNVGDI